MPYMRSILVVSLCLLGLCIADAGCTKPDPVYGHEQTKSLTTRRRQVWAVAPVINLSGEKGVDAFLQADLVFQQLQQVQGVTAVPVNRVAEVYATLRIDRVASPEQAALVCDLLHCDGLIVPTVTIYDTYNPPKLGPAIQLFVKPGMFVKVPNVDPRELAKSAAPRQIDPMPTAGRHGI